MKMQKYGKYKLESLSKCTVFQTLHNDAPKLSKYFLKRPLLLNFVSVYV
jgi:hypothetical protein